MSTKVRSKNGGYFTVPNRWVDAGYMAKAPGSVTQVFLHLSRWANNTTLESAQPMKLIAKKCGLSEDVTRKAVRTLEAWGVLDRDSATGPNAINIWHLNDLLPEAPDYPDKVPPKLCGGPESVGAESGGTYQPNSYQPNDDQPDRGILSLRGTEMPTAWSDFDAFWTAYPSGRGSKKASMEWWKKNVRDPDTADAIMQGLEKWLASEQWQEPRFIKHAERWLRDRLWENPPPPAKANGSATRGMDGDQLRAYAQQLREQGR